MLYKIFIVLYLKFYCKNFDKNNTNVKIMLFNISYSSKILINPSLPPVAITSPV